MPVAGVLQSSLDMYGSKVGNDVEEDADAKAGCVTLIFLLNPCVWCCQNETIDWFMDGAAYEFVM